MKEIGSLYIIGMYLCAYCGLTFVKKKKNTDFSGGHTIATKSSVFKKYTMTAAIKKKKQFYRRPFLVLLAARKKIDLAFNGNCFLASPIFTITSGQWTPLKVFFIVQLTDGFLLPAVKTAATKNNSGNHWPTLKLLPTCDFPSPCGGQSDCR